MTHRMIPPANGFYNPITVFGKSYGCAAGATVDVPDNVAEIMKANGWTQAGDAGAGATAARPANARIGQTFLDTSLGYAIKWDGKSWRNPATGAAV